MTLGDRTPPRGVSRRHFLALLGAGASLPLLAACQATPEAPSPTTAPAGPGAAPAATAGLKSAVAVAGGILNVAVSTDPDTLDAPDTIGSLGQWIEMNLFDRLVGLAPDLSVRPELAESWTPSSDRLTWTFKLRTDARFHDGEPVDAEAVKFNIDRILDEAKPLRRRTLFTTIIKEARIVDSSTIELGLQNPFAGLPQLMTLPYAGIASPKAVREFGDDYARNPVGSGPFFLKSWTSGQGMVLARNDNYWGEKAKLDEVAFQVVPEAGTRAAMLETGEMDVAEHMPPSEMRRLESNPNIQALRADALEARAIKFNVQHPLFQDVRVRQAMNYAVDVPEIIDTILLGAGTYTGGPMPKAVPWAVQSEKYRHDPEMARRLLADAGHPNGFQTTLIGTAARASGIQEMLEALQAQWQAVGIDVTLDIMDTAVFSRTATLGPEEGKDKQLISVGLSTTYPDPHPALVVFHSSQWSPGGNNRGFYKNDRVDELLDLGSVETDPARREAAYREAQELIIEDAPEVFLYTTGLIYGARSNVHDIELMPTQVIHFAGITKS